MSNLIPVIVHTDTLPDGDILYPNSPIAKVMFPRDLVFMYYTTELNKPWQDFDNWLSSYTLAETLCLIDFAEEQGYTPDMKSLRSYEVQFTQTVEVVASCPDCAIEAAYKMIGDAPDFYVYVDGVCY